MTAKELPFSMNYRPYKTIEATMSDGIIYTEIIKKHKTEQRLFNIPLVYALLKVTGEDVLIHIDLSDNKTYSLNVPKNAKCVLYRHKNFHILDSHVKCGSYSTIDNDLLSDENIVKMAEEYTGGHEDYQGFVLACHVIADELKKQNK